MSKDGEQIFTMNSEVIGLPSLVSGDPVQSVCQKVFNIRSFTISEISCEFPQISRTALYEIVTVGLGYHHKFYARWVPKMLAGVHKMQRMESTLTF
jgi:hypothetical protein